MNNQLNLGQILETTEQQFKKAKILQDFNKSLLIKYLEYLQTNKDELDQYNIVFHALKYRGSNALSSVIIGNSKQIYPYCREYGCTPKIWNELGATYFTVKNNYLSLLCNDDDYTAFFSVDDTEEEINKKFKNLTIYIAEQIFKNRLNNIL